MPASDSLRAEMAGQLAAAQADMDARIMELQRSSAAVPASLMAEMQGQLAGLANLQRSLATASPMMLQSLREHVTASVAAAGAASQQAREVAASGERVQATRLETIAEVNRATRDSVTSLVDDLYEKRIFDPYLTFSSPQEEAAYREREGENKKYIQEQLDKNSTEGNLNAASAAVDQMLDINANGGGKSPGFGSRLQDMREKLADQREVAKAEGVSTVEADRRVESGVRRLLQKRGVPEAEITTKLRAAEDPLDVAEPYIESPKGVRSHKVAPETPPQQQAVTEAEAETPAQPIAQAAEEPQPQAAAPAKSTVTPAPAPAAEAPAKTAAVGGLDPKLMAQLGALASVLQNSGVALTDACKAEGHGLSAGCVAPKAVGHSV